MIGDPSGSSARASSPLDGGSAGRAGTARSSRARVSSILPIRQGGEPLAMLDQERIELLEEFTLSGGLRATESQLVLLHERQEIGDGGAQVSHDVREGPVDPGRAKRPRRVGEPVQEFRGA